MSGKFESKHILLLERAHYRNFCRQGQSLNCLKGKLLLENGQLGDLRAEFEYIKNKMADQN